MKRISENTNCFLKPKLYLNLVLIYLHEIRLCHGIELKLLPRLAPFLGGMKFATQISPLLNLAVNKASRYGELIVL